MKRHTETAPTHPGTFLKAFLPGGYLPPTPEDLEKYEVAQSEFTDFIEGRSAEVSWELCRMLKDIYGGTRTSWVLMQKNYTDWHERAAP